MYKIKKLTNFYHSNYLNCFQIINLSKGQFYPHYKNTFIKNIPTNFILHYGEIKIKLESNESNESNVSNVSNKVNKLTNLISKEDLLYQEECDHDLILKNERYILQITPNIKYSFYSNTNSCFQLFFKSDDNLNYIKKK